ncbi:HAD-IC family P-type ATPase [Actinomadura hibisca]|uniref:HAD-IC family P-type ATPase n=1 Tax=Actinomadura hibisca TaxID=68565 RepID=UPI002480EE6E|nr:HAD-IC family P-type ATPase [Actinomadura hibisca]
MAYSGTFAPYGQGAGLVTATGADTEIGLVHRLVDQATDVQTPLTKKIAHFSKLVTVAILGLAAVTFAVGVLRGQPVAEMLTAAVAPAVGAIPEGLHAVVAITLAFGVARMVRRNVIIRRLPAVETLGSTTVICTDKTGTPTRNQMTVTDIAAGGRRYEVTGTGYAPHGDLRLDGRPEPLDRRRIDELVEGYGRCALRVLAFARADLAPGTTRLDGLPRLTLLGLQAMHDPPRDQAAPAVRACRAAGIQVKMITGDHVATARAVGEQIGLEGAVLTGTELAACSDDELPDAVERTAVFARVSPEQKLRLVRALQSRSHVIAMTGDGVNDAPALKQADIGIAMGRGGTEVAKESADMILTDDDFASIKAAVEEGRGVFDNLVKFIVWALPANIGLGLVLMAAVLGGGELPILPVQVLWLNMTAVLILGLPFAVEPRDDDIMRRPPRDPSLPLLTRALTARVLLVAAILLAGAFGLFHWEQDHGASLAEARTVVVNVFAVTLLAYLFNCLSIDRPMVWRGVRRNPWVGVGALALLAVQALYTYAPFMNELFHSAPLGTDAWTRVVAVAVLTYGVIELAKWAPRLRQ